jgi:hypothetical protein
MPNFTFQLRKIINFIQMNLNVAARSINDFLMQNLPAEKKTSTTLQFNLFTIRQFRFAVFPPPLVEILKKLPPHLNSLFVACVHLFYFLCMREGE